MEPFAGIGLIGSSLLCAASHALLAAGAVFMPADAVRRGVQVVSIGSPRWSKMMEGCFDLDREDVGRQPV